MQQANDLSRCLVTLEQDDTVIAVIEMSQASWLVAGLVPGIERHPLKKLEPSSWWKPDSWLQSAEPLKIHDTARNVSGIIDSRPSTVAKPAPMRMPR